MSCEYDEKGRIIQEQYYNVDDQPVNSIAGYCKVVRDYGEDGTVSEEHYYDLDGKEITK